MLYITNPEKAYRYLRTHWPSEISRREKVMIVYLDHKYSVIGHEILFVGGRDSCTIDFRVIFQYAIRQEADHILIAHNHPSGVLEASRGDIEVTERLVRGGEVLGMKVAHMIITREDYRVLAFFE